MSKLLCRSVLFLLAMSTVAAAQQKATLPVTADTGITSVRGKTALSNGLGPTTPIRQNQNWSGFENKDLIMAFDTKAIAGWTVSKAVLHVYLAKGDLYGVGLCSVLAPWQEGKAINFQDSAEGSSWDMAVNGGTPPPARGKKPPVAAGGIAPKLWSWPGSKFYSVSWVHPAAIFSHAGPGDITRELVDLTGKPIAGQIPTTSPYLPPADPVGGAGAAGQPASPRFVHLTIPIDPKVVESLAAGVAYGVVLTDDKGQVAESYSLLGPAYPYYDNDSADAWMFTRDISESLLRPRLEVEGAPTDKTPPGAPKDLKVTAVSASAGTAMIEFIAPGDDGDKGTVLAYEAAALDKSVHPNETIGEQSWPGSPAYVSPAKALPRWAMPKPVAPGKLQGMPIFTLPPSQYVIGIRAVDKAGNRGPVATVSVEMPKPPKAELGEARRADPGYQPVADAGKTLTVIAYPDMVKIDPVSGWICRRGEGYSDGQTDNMSSIWRPEAKRVELSAAANEVVSFQLVVGKTGEKLAGVKVKVGDLAGPNGKIIPASGNVEPFRLWYMEVPREKPAVEGPGIQEQGSGGAWRGGMHLASNYYADACLPLKAPFDETFAIPAADNAVPDQKVQSVWVDLYVPRGTAEGEYKGTISITADGQKEPLSLDLVVKVLPISLPDENTWTVELNCYHSILSYTGVDAKKDPDGAVKALHEYYRLAHAHRTALNVLGYTHAGRVDADVIPVMKDAGTTACRVADWTAYDKQFGPLLDGSAFTDRSGYIGPGAGVPINHTYLAFHEAWPMPINAQTYRDWQDVKDRVEFADYAKKSRRPEVAFTKEYQDGWVAVAKQFMEHYKAKGWNRTAFQFMGNNKYYWKVAYFGGMSRGGVSFWLFDEPSDFDDYDTIAFLMKLARRGVEAAGAADLRVHYRCDVSQPDMTRTLWDNMVTLWSGGNHFAPTAVARQRWLPDEIHWAYGGGPGVSAAPVASYQQLLNIWASGFAGSMPYWDCFRGRGEAWKKADDLAIVYSGANYANSGKNFAGPIASVRLKLLRRCQQDMEYLQLLARSKGWDYARARSAIAPYADDPAATILSFEKLTLETMDQLRRQLAATVIEAAK